MVVVRASASSSEMKSAGLTSSSLTLITPTSVVDSAIGGVVSSALSVVSLAATVESVSATATPDQLITIRNGLF